MEVMALESLNDSSHPAFPEFWERELRERCEAMGVKYTHWRQAQAVFLAAYVECLGKAPAAAVAQRSLLTVRNWNQEDPIFRDCFTDAKEAGFDLLHGEAVRRAKDGVEISVRDRKGFVIGSERKKSDAILQALLKLDDPEQRMLRSKTESQRSDDAWRGEMAKVFADERMTELAEALADSLAAKQQGGSEG